MFKPTELYTPLKYVVNAEQDYHFDTPKTFTTDTLCLEGVTDVDFRYDSSLECGDDVVIDWCEIVITFEGGNQMFIKTTDSHVLDAFGFDWHAAYEAVPEDDKPSWSAYKEHNTYWGL